MWKTAVGSGRNESMSSAGRRLGAMCQRQVYRLSIQTSEAAAWSGRLSAMLKLPFSVAGGVMRRSRHLSVFVCLALFLGGSACARHLQQQGESMAPTIPAGSHVIVNRVVGTINRG